VSELDSQASAIKHTRTSTESSLSGPSIHSDRRQRQCCLCICLQRGAREVHGTIRGRIVTHLAFAYQVESALTVNAIVDHN
jgi:hypothetical protein